MHLTFRRAPLAAVLLLAFAAAVSACGDSTVPTIPPIASQEAPAAGDPTPIAGQPEGPVIVAVNVAFEPVAFRTAADKPLTITFLNKDQGIPHDLVIKDAAGNELAKTEILTGPAQAQLSIGALAAGSYPFVCTIHPNMTGAITVQ